MNIYSKKLMLNTPQLLFDKSTPGTYDLRLRSGVYEITMIGGGGAGMVLERNNEGVYYYARGSVGGTLQVIVNVYVNTTIRITIGVGGKSASGTFSGNTSSVIQGEVAGDTFITGISGVSELKAYAGGSVKFDPSLAPGLGHLVGGAQGATVAKGDAIVENKRLNHDIPSSGGFGGASSPRAPNGRPNTNWPEDTARGQGGDGGWNNTGMITLNGGSGYVRIRRA